MELQFSKTVLDCMKTAAWDVKNEELVQEVRLPEGMDDISRVLGTWGQLLIRSKEWRSEGMSISGGVTAWILYAGEKNAAAQCVEVWMPYQIKWAFPDVKRDGNVLVTCSIRSMDARMVSARKMMLRCVISVAGQGLEPTSIEVYHPLNIPQDIQMLQRTYPVTVAKEAGEKTFVLDEEFTLPVECSDCDKLIQYSVQPEIVDRKIMADKAVFRGSVILNLLCRCEDGLMHSCEFEIPVSQYAELEKEYGPNAQLWISPAVTNVEPELGEDGTLRVKIGMIGQFIVYDTEEITVVEDVFSPERSVQPQLEILEYEALLDTVQHSLKAEKTMNLNGSENVDVSFFCGQPAVYADSGRTEIAGSFQVLTTDVDDCLQSDSAGWSVEHTMMADPSTKMMACCYPTGKGQVIFGGDESTVKHDLLLDSRWMAINKIPMVTGITAEEHAEKDPSRPNLILRRAEDKSLWQLAKSCGSTVERICEANNLNGEPDPDAMLLIPVV